MHTEYELIENTSTDQNSGDNQTTNQYTEKENESKEELQIKSKQSKKHQVVQKEWQINENKNRREKGLAYEVKVKTDIIMKCNGNIIERPWNTLSMFMEDKTLCEINSF